MTVLINRNMYYVDMSSEENVVLSVFLAERGVISANVTINIINGAVIGSRNANLAALATGNLTGKNVILNNNGEIQGAGGAVHRNGGPALHISTDITLNNFGAIRSGGGGGAKGGSGATGNWVEPWSGRKWGSSDYLFFRPTSEDRDCQWADVDVGVANNFPYVYSNRTGKKWYMYTYAGCNPDGFSCWWHYIKRSTVIDGTAGSGGNGGRGLGYRQSRHNGVSGAKGTNYAGRGGNGGRGGWWGNSGNKGNKGNKGSVFGGREAAGHTNYRYKRVSTNPPAYTSAQYSPGKAINVTSGTILTYDVNQGTVNGPTSGTIIAPVPTQKLDLNFLKVG